LEGVVRVLHILNSPGVGGIEKLTVDFVKTSSFLNKDIINDILFVGRNDGDMTAVFEALECNIFFGKLSSGYDINFRKLYKINSIFQMYDILHIHTFNPFVAFFALISKKKIVYTEHGNFGFGREIKPFESVKFFLLKFFLHVRVDRCIYNSQFTKKIADSRFGPLRRNKGGVIYNGIELINPNDVLDHPNYKNIDLQGKYIVGTISRLAGFKRVDRLIKSFYLFQKDKENVLLLIVGNGILTNELKSLVKELGVQKKVLFIGYQQDTLSWIKTMSVCVFASSNEPFGLVAIEAMSMNKPVIVFRDGGGLVETVGNLSQDDVVKSKANAVERLEYYYDLFNKNDLEKFNSITVANQFSIIKMTHKVLKVYKQL